MLQVIFRCQETTDYQTASSRYKQPAELDLLRSIQRELARSYVFQRQPTF